MKTNGILSTGEVGNIQNREAKEQRKMICEKWESFSLLDGLEGIDKENTAMLYENQASWMLNESTYSDSSGAFETVAFPIIRRVFSKLLANEVVSVQALDRPIGRAYYINPKISQRKNDGSHYSIDGGFSNAADNFSKDDNLRRNSKTGGTQYESKSLYDQFYSSEVDNEGDQLFDRTSGRRKLITGGTSAETATYGTTRKLGVNLTGFTLTERGKLIGPIGSVPADTDEFLKSLKVKTDVDLDIFDGGTTIVPAGKALRWRPLAQTYGQALVDNSGNIKGSVSFIGPSTSGEYAPLSASTDASALTFTYEYYVYSDLEDDAEMGEVTFDFDFVTVDVGDPKKLRATYTPEIAQDVMAFHSINIEAEMTSLISETVAQEIDRGILRSLRRGAAWTGEFDYNGFNGRSGITRKDYNQELIEVINQISAQIQKSTLMGGATWLVVSPEVQALMYNLEYFHATDASPEETKFSMGIEKIGTLGGRYQVFVDAYAPASVILLGHKGNNIMSTGFVYCPYVPLMLMPKAVDYKTGKSVHILMSRYAMKMINNRFYGKVYVDNIPTYGVGEF